MCSSDLGAVARLAGLITELLPGAPSALNAAPGEALPALELLEGQSVGPERNLAEETVGDGSGAA